MPAESAAADLVGVGHRAQPRDLGDRLLEAQRAMHHLGHLEVNLHHRHRPLAQPASFSKTHCKCNAAVGTAESLASGWE